MYRHPLFNHFVRARTGSKTSFRLDFQKSQGLGGVILIKKQSLVHIHE